MPKKIDAPCAHTAASYDASGLPEPPDSAMFLGPSQMAAESSQAAAFDGCENPEAVDQTMQDVSGWATEADMAMPEQTSIIPGQNGLEENVSLASNSTGTKQHTNAATDVLHTNYQPPSCYDDAPDSSAAKQKARLTGRNRKSRQRTPEQSTTGHGACQDSVQGREDLTTNDLMAFLTKARQNSIIRQAEADRAAPTRPQIEIESREIAPEDTEAAAFRQMKKLFMAKQASGNLTVEEEIHFKRQEQAEARRKANLRRDRGEEPAGGDDELFLEGTGADPYMEGVLHRERAYDVSDEDSADSDASGPAVTSNKRKTKASSSKPKKRGRKENTAAAGPSGKARSKQKAKPPTKRELMEKQKQANLLATDFFNGASSVFKNVASNTAPSNQPGFSARRKKDAFKELIASIPEQNRDGAIVDVKQLDAACKKFTGQGSCFASGNGEWQVKGMVSTLTHYQMLGVSVMRERESTPENRPAGGLHADAMGLGKTVMAIANIVNDRYTLLRKDKKSRHAPTLIVAPSSIIPQWKDECEKHADEKSLGKIIIYKPGMEKEMEGFPYKHGVVITSYQQVMKSFPKKDPPVDLMTEQEKADWWNKYYEEHRGFFHRLRWRRIVLDEATAIKNYQSQTAIACTEMEADYRWALTGTPAMNALDEFYSYFRFLRTAYTGSYQVFRKNFLSDENDGRTGKERLIAFLRPFMLRRTHASTMFGAKLLDLPEPSRNTFRCHFSSLHQQLYDVVKRRFIEKINIISKRGELRKQYTCVLTLLLRLRQLTGHPLLIQDTMRDLLEPVDFERIEEILENAEAESDSDQQMLIVHLRRMMTEKEQLAVLDTGSPMAVPPDENIAAEEAVQAHLQAKAGGAFGRKDDFAGFMQELRQENSQSTQMPSRICVRCQQEAQPAIETTCKHIYCEACTMKDTSEALQEGRGYNLCAECGERYSTTLRYEVENLAQNHAHNLERYGVAPKFTDSADGKARIERPKANIIEVINTWLNKEGKMLPSAKTIAIKAQILNWKSEENDCKIIVYTQFNTMLNIIHKICQLEDWTALKYNGSMSPQARARAIRKFANDPNVTILISSLRCGGLGLNLTMATRVLLVDPWWNVAVEEQAFCRTYRRGQTQKTRMTRLVVNGTVDDHMITLQDRKIGEIESVMGDESRNKALPISNLLALFGPVGHDAEGNQFVYTEDAELAGACGRTFADEDTLADAGL